MIFITAVMWGLYIIVFFPENSVPHQSLLAFVVAGNTAAVVSVLSARLLYCYFYLSLNIVPLIVMLVLSGTTFSLEMSGMISLYLLTLLKVAHKNYQSTIKVIQLDIDVKASQKALVESDTRFKLLVEHAADALILHEVNGNILDVNPQTLVWFQYDRDDVIGKSISFLAQIEVQDEILKATCGKTTFPRNLETVMCRKDGTTFTAQIHVNSLDYNEKPLLLSTIRDISEQKQVEKALLESRNNAIEANQAKSEFLSRMSHELRTPLNAILGFSQLMESEATEEQLENLREIRSAGAHLLELVNDVLDLAKIESGSNELKMQRYDVSSLVSECKAMVQPAAKKLGIELVFMDLEENKKPVFIDCDPLRFKQALLNIISNAIKYNQKNGYVTISISADTSCRISVQDNGLGIPTERQGELFQSFNRLGAEYSMVEGTGVGLVITKKLVEQMGGKIGFSSEVGVGSNFWIEFLTSADQKKYKIA
ncbi:MAG: PAS domain-containing sensor histidine kinase [Gammaproteobacteria bacterium]|nr:PAS domain-containing sensor histidine kinase [Gammaproteobacteria bacterium]